MFVNPNTLLLFLYKILYVKRPCYVINDSLAYIARSISLVPQGVIIMNEKNVPGKKKNKLVILKSGWLTKITSLL